MHIPISIGKQIFTQLYPGVKSDELIPYKVVAPSSKASAHIDLIHENVNFKVWDQETWLHSSEQPIVTTVPWFCRLKWGLKGNFVPMGCCSTKNQSNLNIFITHNLIGLKN